ncbi:hypothetical protein BAE44_0008751 [Dichanthelium oligosanthes]|uniref:NB-ARC domain-containing protein n=1 Tax=Dichanthelium oligosanthes TaxID=888268 RepID=A0A1E5VYQ3_9POAL|nr:hypothetical protein BAE44_0008751 [Dichanthelium oligosanthes]
MAEAVVSAVVADAAADARRVTSRALLEWLAELADGSRRGRYFLDAFGGEAVEMTDEDEGEGDDHGEAGVPLSLFRPSSLNPAKRMRVATRRMLFRGGGGAGDFDGCCPPALHRPLATNISADCQMFGRHLERHRVIDFLLQDNDDGGGELGVLPIIGRAGLGKTTLVQHVCD